METDKRFLMRKPGLSTHAKGRRGVRGNGLNPLLSSFARGQCPRARVHEYKLGRRKCSCVTRDGSTVNSGNSKIEHVCNKKNKKSARFLSDAYKEPDKKEKCLEINR